MRVSKKVQSPPDSLSAEQKQARSQAPFLLNQDAMNIAIRPLGLCVSCKYLNYLLPLQHVDLFTAEAIK